MAGLGRIIVLGAADLLASYAMFMMIIYLTDVWKLGFTLAAAIINIFWGVVSVLPLSLTFIEKSVGNRFVVLTTTIFYSIGLVLLTLSTPPVLGRVLGTCSEFEPRCIGQSQRILFYIALPLIAVGMSGYKNTLQSFLSDQVIDDIPVPDAENFLVENATGLSVPNAIYTCFGRTEMFFAKVVAVLVLPYFKSWSIRFGVPAAFTLLVTLLFLLGSSSYKFRNPEGSTLKRFFRVFVAAASKLFHPIPGNGEELYETQDDEFNYIVSHTDGLRCLDKAAIILPTKPLEQQKTNQWTLCTVTEVEDTKMMVRMIPVCIPLVLCGVVSAIGWAYFVAQLGHMNPKIGSLTVSIGIMLWFHEQIKDQDIQSFRPVLALSSSSLAVGIPDWKNIYSLAVISMSMITAIICCMIAGAVEDRRLGVVQKHGLVDKPDELVPMTMFWLLPQFVLLAAFTGHVKPVTRSYFESRFPKAARSYLSSFVEALFGIGILCSVVVAYIVGKVTEMGGKKNWFQETLNTSRLDKYFWTLAWLMAINLVVFLAVGLWYRTIQPGPVVREEDYEQLALDPEVRQLLLDQENATP